jgi:hypothetical protein
MIFSSRVLLCSVPQRLLPTRHLMDSGLSRSPFPSPPLRVGCGNEEGPLETPDEGGSTSFGESSGKDVRTDGRRDEQQNE